MNTKVTATGMQVQAKSNDTFLLIGDGTMDTPEKIQNLKKTTLALNVTANEAAVYPSKPVETSEIGDNALFATGKAVPLTAANADIIGTTPNWYTANSTDPSESVKDIQNQTVLNDKGSDPYNYKNYVIVKHANLTLAKGSEDASNLTVKGTFGNYYTSAANTTYSSEATYYIQQTVSNEDGTTTISYEEASGVTADNFTNGTYFVSASDHSAVKALVVANVNGEEQMVTLSTSNFATPHSLYTGDLTDNKVIPIDIYIYYDGSDATVKTNNIANLAGATINLEFGVEVK